MKKLLLGLFVIAAISVNAQIEKGKKFAGINFNAGKTGGFVSNSSTVTASQSVFSFRFLPKVGMMLSDNLGLGIAMGYDYKKTTTPNDLGTYTQIERDGKFLITPFLRYYKNVTEKFYLFGQAALPISVGSHKQLKLNDKANGTVDDYPTTNISYGFDISLGANYFITDRIALETTFGLFNMGYISNVSVSSGSQTQSISHSSSTYFSLNTDNVFNTGSISVGVKIFI